MCVCVFVCIYLDVYQNLGIIRFLYDNCLYNILINIYIYIIIIF